MCSNGFTLIINSVGNQDDKSIRINWTFQPTRAHWAVHGPLPKWPHFHSLNRTTVLQPSSPLSPNSAKFPFHKPFFNSALQKSKKVVTYSMYVTGWWVAASNSRWLKCRNRMSQKNIVTTEILVFDFELFIGGLCSCSLHFGCLYRSDSGRWHWWPIAKSSVLSVEYNTALVDTWNVSILVLSSCDGSDAEKIDKKSS